MRWFRTINGLVPWLVGLLLVAQLGGAVAFDRAGVGMAGLSTSVHAQGHQHATQAHEHAAIDDSGSSDDHCAKPAGALADQCCALHLLAGVLPPPLAAHVLSALGESLTPAPAGRVAGLGPDALDRPPKSL
jgi:hypothetical protein